MRPVPDFGGVKWLKHRLVTMAECMARKVVSGRRLASMSMSPMISWLLSASDRLPGAIPETQVVGVVAVAMTATVMRARASMPLGSTFQHVDLTAVSVDGLLFREPAVMGKRMAKNLMSRDGQSVAKKPM